MNVKENLLTAAMRIISRNGVTSMTLDAVAKEAGVSKGALTHHFVSKDSLVVALLALAIEQLLREVDRHAADDPEITGRLVRAMMRTAFPWLNELHPPAAEDVQARSPAEQLFLAVVTASVVNPELLGSFREQAHLLMHRILKQDPRGMEQLVIWLALDGLSLWNHFGLLTERDPLYEHLVRHMFACTYGATPPPAAVTPLAPSPVELFADSISIPAHPAPNASSPNDVGGPYDH
jgi:AcrR family transcriptional regulator